MDSKTLHRVNSDTVTVLIPAIVLISILMVIGLIGNPLVIYFYGIRLKPTASYIFITSLACYDLVSCLISMPLEIVDLIYFFTFQSAVACRTLRFVNYFAHIASGGTLIAIAVDRFRKLCRPFERQISNRQARLVIVGVIGFTILSAWPSFVFYTVVEVNITIPSGSITGFDCSTNPYGDHTDYLAAYNIYLMMLFFISLIVLVVLYSLIARQLYELRSFRFYTSQNARGAPPTRTLSSMTLTTEINSVSNTVPRVINVAEAKGQMANDEDDDIGDADDLADRGLTPIEEDSSSSASSVPVVSRLKTLSTSINKLWSNKVEPEMFDYDFEEEIELDDDIVEHPVVSARPIRQSQSFTERSVQKKFHKPRRTRSEMSIKTLKLFQASGSRVGTAHRFGSGNISRLSWKTRTIGIGHQLVNGFPDVDSTRVARCASVDVDQLKMRAQNINTRKFTVIATSITVAFIVSFLPFLVLATWSSFATTHEANYMNNSELVAFQIFIRSFLFNSVCNPFIYGFLNVEFKSMIVKGFRRLYSRIICVNNKEQGTEDSEGHQERDVEL